jgi:isopentenyl-diphosphate delta-isomerase
VSTVHTAEQVVLLDDEGNAIGTADKAGVHHAHTPLHLAFSCYVFDSAGRLLLTQRALHKTTWPGAWTNSLCGHPAPGEPLADAVRRRAVQELGLDLGEVRLSLPTFGYRALMDNGVVENERCPVLTTVTDLPPAPVADEVADTAWVPWAEFRATVLDGTRDVSPWCREQVAALPEDPLGTAEADWSLLPPAARRP